MIDIKKQPNNEAVKPSMTPSSPYKFHGYAEAPNSPGTQLFGQIFSGRNLNANKNKNTTSKK